MVNPNHSFDAKSFLHGIVVSGRNSFTLPANSKSRQEVLNELGTGYAQMGDKVEIGFSKKIELRKKLTASRDLARNRTI